MKNSSKTIVCLGLPLYNNDRYLPEAIESILKQSYKGFKIVAIDDASDDNTDQIMKTYISKDRRIVYERNDETVGLISNWRKVFLKANKLYAPKYFAWISDHDIWHAQWLGEQIKLLENNPDIALVHSGTSFIHENGSKAILDKLNAPNTIDTFQLGDIESAMKVCTTEQTGAGNAVYGVFRTSKLKRAGIFRDVVMPDRLLITEISAYGRIKYLPKILRWRRIFNDDPNNHYQTIQRQIKSVFGGGDIPLHAMSPIISHCLCLLIYVGLLSRKKNNSFFWKGLMMSSMLYKSYENSFVRDELEAVHLFITNNIDVYDKTIEQLDDVNSTKQIFIMIAKSILNQSSDKTIGDHEKNEIIDFLDKGLW